MREECRDKNFHKLKNLILEDANSVLDNVSRDIRSLSSDSYQLELVSKSLVTSLNLLKVNEPAKFDEVFEDYIKSKIKQQFSNNQESFAELTSKHLAHSFHQSFQKDQDVYTENFSEILPNAIKQNDGIDSGDNLTTALAPYISKSISRQVEKDKDVIIDALYPVIGGTINKYLSEAMKEMVNRINNQIEEKLSFSKKIKKIISFSKQKEINNVDINHLFLIDKKTGAMIFSDSNRVMSEQHMVSSMFSAITSFVQDWIDQECVSRELDSFNFGNKKIIFEKNGSFILACEVNQLDEMSAKIFMRSFLIKITKKYFGGSLVGKEESLRLDLDEVRESVNQDKVLLISPKSSSIKNYLVFSFFSFIIIFCALFLVSNHNKKILQNRLDHILGPKTNVKIVNSLFSSFLLTGYLNNEADINIFSKKLSQYYEPDYVDSLVKEVKLVNSFSLSSSINVEVKRITNKIAALDSVYLLQWTYSDSRNLLKTFVLTNEGSSYVKEKINKLSKTSDLKPNVDVKILSIYDKFLSYDFDLNRTDVLGLEERLSFLAALANTNVFQIGTVYSAKNDGQALLNSKRFAEIKKLYGSKFTIKKFSKSTENSLRAIISNELNAPMNKFFIIPIGGGDE